MKFDFSKYERYQKRPGKKKMHFQLWILEMHLQNYKTKKKLWILQMHFHGFCKCIFMNFANAFLNFANAFPNFANAFSFFENAFALILQIPIYIMKWSGAPLFFGWLRFQMSEVLELSPAPGKERRLQLQAKNMVKTRVIQEPYHRWCGP